MLPRPKKETLPSVQRRQWQSTPVFLPRKSHGRRSLIGCSPWGREESDRAQRLHFSLSCIREGNGNPLQCYCLKNPRDGGAWWAAVYGVTQSRTRLKQLSSSSSCSRNQCKDKTISNLRNSKRYVQRRGHTQKCKKIKFNNMIKQSASI